MIVLQFNRFSLSSPLIFICVSVSVNSFLHMCGKIFLEEIFTHFGSDSNVKIQLQEWIRTIVANRVATDGKSWSNYFSMHNSGTYNNQWMVVDYKLFKPGKDIR